MVAVVLGQRTRFNCRKSDTLELGSELNCVAFWGLRLPCRPEHAAVVSSQSAAVRPVPFWYWSESMSDQAEGEFDTQGLERRGTRRAGHAIYTYGLKSEIETLPESFSSAAGALSRF